MTKGTLFGTILSFALAFSAFAQEREVKTGGAGKEETVKLMVNGWANVYWALTNGDLNETSKWTPGGDPTGDDNDANAGVVGEVSLRFQATLQDAVDVVVELRTRDTANDVAQDGTNYLGGSSANGTADPTVRHGYVSVRELIGPEWGLKLGVQPVKFDLRGRGNALFLDSENAESAFRNGPFAGAISGILSVRPETYRDELNAVGLVLNYKKDKMCFEFGAVEMVPGESFSQFNPESDESLYYANLIYEADDMGSKYGAIVALMKAAESRSRAWTIGAGASLKNLGQKGLEVFAEGYLQTGTLYDQPNLLPPTPKDVDAKGFLVNAGVRLDLEGEGAPWVELSFLWVSGQEDSNASGALDATEDETDEFFSYEGNDDLLILEDHVVGLDIDNNYWTGRIKAGTTLGEKKNIKVEARAAVATAVEDIEVILGGVQKSEDALGWEFDLSLTYVVNKNASVYVAGGWLTGADVLEFFTEDREDSAFAVKVGTFVNW